jgi:molybdopterin molybdotransferase
MISVKQARNIIQSQTQDWGTCSMPLVDTLGEVLAEDIFADLDFPPFDRVSMDGITLSYDKFLQGERQFLIQETQLAGEPVVTLKDPNNAIEIMTGAVLSNGCDMVIRYEDLDFFEKDNKKYVTVNLENSERWKNVHRQGSDNKAGELLVKKGCTITSAEIAIMATVGYANVLVNKKPKVAVISTGTELVNVDQKPLPHQIRKSNAIALQASLNQLRIPNELFHLDDDKEILHTRLTEILVEYDVILLSGGVSKGKVDFLPEILASLNVEKKFHRVAQRPGKPFWFGMTPDNKAVFAFPGNPISTYMCFLTYCIPWINSNLGKSIASKTALLKESFSFKPNLGYFLQVRSEKQSNHEIHVYPQAGNGSGDLANLAFSDAFLYLPEGQGDYEAGKQYEYYSFDISTFA